MKKQKNPEKEKFDLEAIYLGERVGIVGDIKQEFRAKGGRLLSFSKVRRPIFGESYFVSKGGSILLEPARVEKQTLSLTDQERLDFETHKELAKIERLKKRKAMDLKKPHPNIVKALELLRPFVRGADNFTLKRFTGYLEHQLSKKGKRK